MFIKYISNFFFIIFIKIKLKLINFINNNNFFIYYKFNKYNIIK